MNVLALSSVCNPVTCSGSEEESRSSVTKISGLCESFLNRATVAGSAATSLFRWVSAPFNWLIARIYQLFYSSPVNLRSSEEDPLLSDPAVASKLPEHPVYTPLKEVYGEIFEGGDETLFLIDGREVFHDFEILQVISGCTLEGNCQRSLAHSRYYLKDDQGVERLIFEGQVLEGEVFFYDYRRSSKSVMLESKEHSDRIKNTLISECSFSEEQWKDLSKILDVSNLFVYLANRVFAAAFDGYQNASISDAGVDEGYVIAMGQQSVTIDHIFCMKMAKDSDPVEPHTFRPVGERLVKIALSLHYSQNSDISFGVKMQNLGLAKRESF